MELSTILFLLALFKLTVWITFAAAKPSASCRTNTGISSLNRSCQDHLLIPSKPHFERMYCCLNVDSCSYMIISGYWVGPDIDDGWGYVEAFVNPITWAFFSIPLVFFSFSFWQPFMLLLFGLTGWISNAEEMRKWPYYLVWMG